MVRIKLVVRALSILTLATFAIPLISPNHLLNLTAHASSKTIYLDANSVGSYYYWNSTNPTITVTQGDSITIDLSSSTGSVPHRFLLDFDGDGVSDTADCSPTPPSTDVCTSSSFTSSAMVSFVASTVGTFMYYCTIHYPYMAGQLKVLANISPDFTIAPSPGSLSFVQGSSSTSTITVTGKNGFSGTINLSATSSPTGPSVSLNPTSVTISSTAGTSTLSVNSTTSTPSGSYTITVTGTNGTFPHSTTISLTINPQPSKDFSVTANPTSLNIAQGATGITTITLTSVNGFSGTISLTSTESPSGPGLSFSPTSVSISSGSATSTLTVSTAGGLYTSVPNGNYSINVTTTSGSLSHSTTVKVTVGSSSSTTFPTSPLSVYAAIVVVVVIVAAIAVTMYVVRKKRTT